MMPLIFSDDSGHCYSLDLQVTYIYELMLTRLSITQGGFLILLVVVNTVIVHFLFHMKCPIPSPPYPHSLQRKADHVGDQLYTNG